MYYILYFIFYKNNIISIRNFTPLKIYIGTPEGVPLEIQGQQLPINELNGTPPKAACPILNLQGCKAVGYRLKKGYYSLSLKYIFLNFDMYSSFKICVFR